MELGIFIKIGFALIGHSITHINSYHINPLMLSMMRVGLCSTSDIITLDQNWHQLYSSFAGGKDLSGNQITVIGSIEPEISTKMLRNLVEKLGANNYSQLHLATPW